MHICYLGIGSNLGDRRTKIKEAIEKINSLKGTKILKASSIIETDAVGGPCAQSKFLNAVVKAKTSLLPRQLLKKLKIIEKELGRKKTVRFGPRLIDIDILFYGDKLVKTKKLTIPHKKVFQREFVLKPLLEIL